MGQIRINELARELEVKSKRILDYLAEIGVAEKKSHSSSVEDEPANRVRAHFRALEAAEKAAAAEAERIAAEKVAAARAAAEAEARKAAEAKAAEAKAAEAVSLAHPPAAVPLSARPVPAAATPGRPAAELNVPVRLGASPAAPLAAAATEADARVRTVSRAAAAGPAPVLPKPGQPIYQPKPTPRRPAKTHVEKRYEEGERKLMHPVRTRIRAEPGQRKLPRPGAPAVPVRIEPFSITISEGITVKELAEKLQVAKRLVSIVSGDTSRRKRVQVMGLDVETAAERLNKEGA